MVDRWSAVSCLMVLLALSVCACSAPLWTNGVQSNDYYSRATGTGRTQNAADLRAQANIASEAQDFQLRLRDSISIRDEYSQGTNELEQFAQSIVVDNRTVWVPKGTQVVAQYRSSDTLFSAYAVLALKGATVIGREYSRGIRTARRFAFAPGLAQFKKNEPRKAWRILGTEAVGLIGWGTLSLLSSDLKDRRDRSRRVSSYDYYDKWANRTGWGGLSFGLLVIASYGYSLIDGLLGVPPPHQLLLSVDQDTTWIVALSR
jgi:hypothetical protein